MNITVLRDDKLRRHSSQGYHEKSGRRQGYAKRHLLNRPPLYSLYRRIIQFISSNKHTVSFCFGMYWLCYNPIGFVWLISLHPLTHWGRGKITAISQTTFWNAFSWMKIYEFRWKFQGSMLVCFNWMVFVLALIGMLHTRYIKDKVLIVMISTAYVIRTCKNSSFEISV